MTAATPVALPEIPPHYCGRAMVETFGADSRKPSGDYVASKDYDALRTAAEQLQRRCAELEREVKFMPSMRAQRNAADNRANALTERLAACEKAVASMLALRDGKLQCLPAESDRECLNRVTESVIRQARAALSEPKGEG